LSVAEDLPISAFSPGKERGDMKEMKAVQDQPSNQEVNVGRALSALRAERGLSLRTLAERSGLAVNTLSLIQNGKTSPSVATLQQLAAALEVPITAFFEAGSRQCRISYVKANQRIAATFSHGTLEDLGGGLHDRSPEPFVVTMLPGAHSGAQAIVHTGHEFVYCLEGRITYAVDEEAYDLDPGDSLLFESHLPHRWQNPGTVSARTLLVLCPMDPRDKPTVRHFFRNDDQK
jgi:transcriptional regulator with XRE-family HTH domain